MSIVKLELFFGGVVGKIGGIGVYFCDCHKNIREIGAFCTAGVALGEAGFCGFATEVLEAKALPGRGGENGYFSQMCTILGR